MYILYFTGLALECYVCEAQNNNNDKCIKTTIQCRQAEDTCRTQIRWQRKLGCSFYSHSQIMVPIAARLCEKMNFMIMTK